MKDVDGMINRLPAARGSKGPTDGELSALEEEVRKRSAVQSIDNDQVVLLANLDRARVLLLDDVFDPLTGFWAALRDKTRIRGSVERK